MPVAPGVRAALIGHSRAILELLDPPDAGEFANGYTWRVDYRIRLLNGLNATTDQLVMVRLDLGANSEESGADIRVESASGGVLPHRLIRYDAGDTWLRVRLPAVSAAEDTAFAVYTGRTGASTSNPAGVYEGAVIALDGITGADLTGQGRSLTTTGVTAGAMPDGQPAGVYDGAAFAIREAATPWLNGLPAITLYADLQCDAGADDKTRPVLLQSEGTLGTEATKDTAKLTRLATTSGGVPNAWNCTVHVAGGSAFALGTSGSANDDAQIVAGAWQSGQAPILYRDGEQQPTSNSAARTGTIETLSNGMSLAYLLEAKVAEAFIWPTALSASWLKIDALSKRTPLAIWGVSQGYGVADPTPCIAMPVRAAVEATAAADIDVLASSIGSSLTLESVTQGTRGTVTIEDGKARYTATGSEAGSDFFAYTIEDGAATGSTGRVDVTITASGATSPDPEDELPTPLSEVTLATQAEYDAWKAAIPPAGQHATLTTNVNLGNITFSGTEEAPIVIKASSVLGRTATGCGDISGSHIRVWGFQWGGVSPGLLTGRNLWFIRNRSTGGMRLRFRSPGGRAWYNHWDGGTTGRAIAFDTGANAGGPGLMGIEGHVKGCRFGDWAPGGDNATEVITVGFSDQRTFVESNTLIEGCLFEDCNIGGTEDETIALKTSYVTVRDCTFVRTRFLAVRHGTNHLIDRCVVVDSPTGGFTIRDADTILQNSKTVGNTRTAIFAGNLKPTANGGGQWWTVPTSSLNPQVRWPATYRLKVYNHDAEERAPMIGDKYSPDFSPLCPADDVVWLGNRGVDPERRSSPSGYWVNVTPPENWGDAAPVAYVAPVTLTAGDVGPTA